MVLDRTVNSQLIVSMYSHQCTQNSTLTIEHFEIVCNNANFIDEAKIPKIKIKRL